MYTDILVRFAELSTKGKNKMKFVRRLEKNIKKLIGVKPIVEYDRIFLKYTENSMEKLNYIFGIYSWSPMIKVKTDVESMEESIKALISKIKFETFKIEVKKNWKDFSKSSMELNRHFGTFVLKNSNMKVDVKNPDLKLEIEIREKFTSIFFKRYKGLGGYPVGINGKVLHLISGGIDSPVAAFEIMKRGIHVDFLNFVTPPHTDEKTVKKVDKIVNHLIKFQGEAKIYRSNYTKIMHLIGLTWDQSYKIILMRRSFYRIASTISQKNKYLGLSNGENLGQVASQTLESISVIQDQSNFPVYRPLLTKDKIEIINQAIKIGTYEMSIEKANESCELFAPERPATKPTFHKVKKLEKEMPTLFDFEKQNIEKEIEIINIEK